MPRFDWPSVTDTLQRDEQALPVLGVGANDVVVTWAVPFADTSYSVHPAIETGAVNVGGIRAALKAGTRTTNGCTITVTNTTLVSIGLGSRLMTMGVGPA